MARCCLYMFVVSLLLFTAYVRKRFSVVEEDTITGKSCGQTIGHEQLVDSFDGLLKLVTELKETVEILKSENLMILQQLLDVRKENIKLDTVIQELNEKTSRLELRLDESHSDDKNGETGAMFKQSRLKKRRVDGTWSVDERKQHVSGRFKRLEMESQDPLVAFYATLTQNATNLGPGQNIVFDHALTNLGHAYYAFHGIFTASYKGMYMFSGNVGCNGIHVNVNYVLNDNVVARACGYNYDMDGHTMFLVLNKGDNFSLQSDGNMGTYSILGNAYSSFAGRLVTLLT